MRILNQDFKPVFNLRGMFIFESITDRPFEIKNTMDIYIYFYSCLCANKENPSLEFDEFIDYCSEHPEVFEEFNTLLMEDNERKSIYSKKKEVENN